MFLVGYQVALCPEPSHGTSFTGPVLSARAWYVHLDAVFTVTWLGICQCALIGNTLCMVVAKKMAEVETEPHQPQGSVQFKCRPVRQPPCRINIGCISTGDRDSQNLMGSP
jgi:hypothetical protein